MTHATALIVAGGTGGHIFPGLSVAKMLLANNWQVKWVGNPNAMEGQLVLQHGIALCPLVFSGFRGKSLLEQILMPFKLVRAFYQAFQIIQQQKPQVVLGMGGYVAFPLCVMAHLFNIPLVIHEQNSVPGLTNRVLAKLTKHVLTAFPRVFKHSQWVGNPVRQEISQQPLPEIRYQNRSGPLRVLVVGGSLGAKALNDVLPNALALIPKSLRPEVVHQTGRQHLEEVQSKYVAKDLQVECVAFIDNMAEAMAQADLLICRAGAMTVAEVAALGVAALFIPYPFAVDNHQTQNAQFLVREDAAWMILQSELTARGLAGWLESIDRFACLDKANKARAIAKTRSTELVVEIMEKVAVKDEA